MRYEKQVKEIGKSPEKLNEFASEFTEIRRLLDRELETEQETETYTRLMELVKEVSDYILAPEPEVQERIGEIMGGKVLELETDRILNRGIQQGLIEGAVAFKVFVFETPFFFPVTLTICTRHAAQREWRFFRGYKV